MTTIPMLVAQGFRDYELIDSGNGAKYERFGKYTVVRPDPRALWSPALSLEKWNAADASFLRTDPQSGDWVVRQQAPKPWHLCYDNFVMELKPTSFKHVGVFPEQHVNWDWIAQHADAKHPLPVLNVFAYTGAATLAAASRGARVTHVDAAKSTIQWAKQNASLSKIAGDRIRWIEDDALKFVQREVRRGSRYQGIVMDPPRFGRGAKNEVWKLEEHLPELISSAVQLLDENDARFFLLNAYTADISSLVLRYLLEPHFKDKKGTIECGELVTLESSAQRYLPSGIFFRWSR